MIPTFIITLEREEIAFKIYLMLAHDLYQTTPKNSLRPDIDDLNNNCRTCQNDYLTRAMYRNHLCHVHQMKLSPLRTNVNHENLPDSNIPHYYIL